jgi:serine/threonine protein kinase
MSDPAAQPFSPGEVLAGKYRVERVLGQGGMGVVLAAMHIHLEERVALKLMLAGASINAEAVGRFVREARAAARLESAHVAKVSDVGTLDDGRPYMVMEYLDGQDLSQVLASTGPLPLKDAVDYVLQAAEAIAEAHSIGIIHRDLKPSNLFLTRRRDRTPHVKVLDFGISKIVSTTQTERDSAMTRTSAMMGSPLYMSPEQMTSVKDVDARSDIWALGVILFELLTGSPPFMGDTLPQVCGLVLQSADPPVSSRRPGLPREVDVLIHRCLAKRPADRFQNIAELARALQGMAGPYGRASVERILSIAGALPSPSLEAGALDLTVKAPESGMPARTDAAWGETKSSNPSRRRGWLIVPLAGGSALLVALGWWFLRDGLAGASPAGSTDLVSTAAPAAVATVPATAVEAAPPVVVPVPVVASATASVSEDTSRAPPPVGRPRPPSARPRPAPSVVRTSRPRDEPSVTVAPTPPAPKPAAADPGSSDLGGRL